MPLIVIASARFAEHQTPPGHPESASRAKVMDAIAAESQGRGSEVVPPRPATRTELARIHDPEYLDRIQATAGKAVALDPDTYTSPDSAEIAQLAAGAAVSAVEHVLEGPHTRAIALVRPPGHHAERTRAMGFCFYNNVAIAAAHARASGIERVAIVDYDVHHGNGTAHAFAGDPSVLYISTHQYPFYPGTGAVEDIGIGPGRGFTVNVPIEAGAVDEDYRLIFSEVVTPVLEKFRPGLLLVSAGFDAHAQDPLAGMRLTSAAFEGMTAGLVKTAEECCDGRIVLVTEGGYNLEALADSLRGVVRVMEHPAVSPVEWPQTSAGEPRRGLDAVRQVRQVLGAQWAL